MSLSLLPRQPILSGDDCGGGDGVGDAVVSSVSAFQMMAIILGRRCVMLLLELELATMMMSSQSSFGLQMRTRTTVFQLEEVQRLHCIHTKINLSYIFRDVENR